MSTTLASFRRTARGFLWGINAALAITVLVLVLTTAVVTVRAHMMTDASLFRIAFAWAPALFYLAAMLFARGLFATLAEDGFSFGPAVVRALRRIGLALACGGLTSCVWGVSLMLSRTRGMGGFAGLAAPGLTIAIVGAALVAIARLIDHAESIRREKTSLSAELEGFV